MENKRFFTGLTATVLSIGLVLAGCDQPTSDSSDSGTTPVTTTPPPVAWVSDAPAKNGQDITDALYADYKQITIVGDFSGETVRIPPNNHIIVVSKDARFTPKVLEIGKDASFTVMKAEGENFVNTKGKALYALRSSALAAADVSAKQPDILAIKAQEYLIKGKIAIRPNVALDLFAAEKVEIAANARIQIAPEAYLVVNEAASVALANDIETGYKTVAGAEGVETAGSDDTVITFTSAVAAATVDGIAAAVAEIAELPQKSAIVEYFANETDKSIFQINIDVVTYAMESGNQDALVIIADKAVDLNGHKLVLSGLTVEAGKSLTALGTGKLDLGLGEAEKITLEPGSRLDILTGAGLVGNTAGIADTGKLYFHGGSKGWTGGEDPFVSGAADTSATLALGDDAILTLGATSYTLAGNAKLQKPFPVRDGTTLTVTEDAALTVASALEVTGDLTAAGNIIVDGASAVLELKTDVLATIKPTSKVTVQNGATLKASNKANSFWGGQTGASATYAASYGPIEFIGTGVKAYEGSVLYIGDGAIVELLEAGTKVVLEYQKLTLAAGKAKVAANKTLPVQNGHDVVIGAGSELTVAGVFNVYGVLTNEGTIEVDGESAELKLDDVVAHNWGAINVKTGTIRAGSQDNSFWGGVDYPASVPGGRTYGSISLAKGVKAYLSSQFVGPSNDTGATAQLTDGSIILKHNDITLDGNATLSSGKTFPVQSGHKLTVKTGGTLTVPTGTGLVIIGGDKGGTLDVGGTLNVVGTFNVGKYGDYTTGGEKATVNVAGKLDLKTGAAGALLGKIIVASTGTVDDAKPAGAFWADSSSNGSIEFKTGAKGDNGASIGTTTGSRFQLEGAGAVLTLAKEAITLVNGTATLNRTFESGAGGKQALTVGDGTNSATLNIKADLTINGTHGSTLEVKPYAALNVGDARASEYITLDFKGGSGFIVDTGATVTVDGGNARLYLGESREHAISSSSALKGTLTVTNEAFLWDKGKSGSLWAEGATGEIVITRGGNAHQGEWDQISNPDIGAEGRLATIGFGDEADYGVVTMKADGVYEIAGKVVFGDIFQGKQLLVKSTKRGGAEYGEFRASGTNLYVLTNGWIKGEDGVKLRVMSGKKLTVASSTGVTDTGKTGSNTSELPGIDLTSGVFTALGSKTFTWGSDKWN